MKKSDLLTMLDALLPNEVNVKPTAMDNGWSISLLISDHHAELPPEAPATNGAAPMEVHQ